MAVVERLGGCCHGAICLCSDRNETDENAERPHVNIVRAAVKKEQRVCGCVVREKAKSGIKTVTEVLLSHWKVCVMNSFF